MMQPSTVAEAVPPKRIQERPRKVQPAPIVAGMQPAPTLMIASAQARSVLIFYGLCFQTLMCCCCRVTESAQIDLEIPVIAGGGEELVLYMAGGVETTQTQRFRLVFS